MEGKREAAGGEGRRKAAQGREDEGGKHKNLRTTPEGFVSIKHTVRERADPWKATPTWQKALGV